MGGQADPKIHQNMEIEGTSSSSNKNSFAVLSNIHIIHIATKMGVQSESLSFEKLDLLKDLENARMKLNEHDNILVDQSNSLEVVILPLEDQNVLDWGTEESEGEPCVLVSSVRKSRSSKKIKKSRAVRKQPVDASICSEGDKSKVSPRFNLRNRNTIKKVYK
jgi:hypothetical protein